MPDDGFFRVVDKDFSFSLSTGICTHYLSLLSSLFLSVLQLKSFLALLLKWVPCKRKFLILIKSLSCLFPKCSDSLFAELKVRNTSFWCCWEITFSHVFLGFQSLCVTMLLFFLSLSSSRSWENGGMKLFF